jgi:hypothetical protein
MRVVTLAIVAGAFAVPAAAQQSAAFPRGHSFIIQLTSSQADSGFGEYLVPPLDKAFRKTGLRYEGSPKAEYAASIETGSDVGKWYGSGEGRAWLYDRFVTVGLSPADADIEPEGRLAPWFSVRVHLITPNEDRVDELNCLVSLAVRELAARYRLKGQVAVDGTGCLRKEP